MALAISTSPDLNQSEARILGTLVRLYEDEKLIYGQVLEVARKQGEALQQGAALPDIRQLLEKKKNCLDTIRRLEMTEKNTKLAWERGRDSWSSAGRARLNLALRTVGRVIEEILICEERNDMILIEQAREF